MINKNRGLFHGKDYDAFLEIFGISSLGKYWESKTETNEIKDVFEDQIFSDISYEVFRLIHLFDLYKRQTIDEIEWTTAKEQFKRKWLPKELNDEE